MKMRIIFCLVIVLLGKCAAMGQTNPVALSEHIARKMKDTLSLNQGQKEKIYAANMDLYRQKELAWQAYSTQDSVRRALQKIENGRDSLYKNILTPAQYLLYRQKKTTLVSSQ